MGRGVDVLTRRLSTIVNVALDGVGKINDGLSWIGIVCLVVIILSVTADVILRFLFKTGWGMAFELSMSAMVVMIWVAVAYTLKQGKHIEVSIITDKLSPKVRAQLKVVIYAICALLCSVFTWSAWTLFERSLSTGEVTVVSKIPVSFLHSFIVIGFVLLALQYVALVRDAWREVHSINQETILPPT